MISPSVQRVCCFGNCPEAKPNFVQLVKEISHLQLFVFSIHNRVGAHHPHPHARIRNSVATKPGAVSSYNKFRRYNIPRDKKKMYYFLTFGI